MPNPDRCFDPEPSQRTLARSLYQSVSSLPLICPHGHVDVLSLAQNTRFGSPAELLVIPDHYVFRMLYSQGVPLENIKFNPDHREVWRTFSTHFHLFRGTPTGLWLRDELESVFGITEKPNTDNADALYDHLETLLEKPEFLPQALFKQFNIATLCTTDAATDSLEPHLALQQAGFDVRPTFRPDKLLDLTSKNWLEEIRKLEALTHPIENFSSFIAAIQTRREHFKAAQATATDHGVTHPRTKRLSRTELETIFSKALHQQSYLEDMQNFTAHMLLEFAQMSIDDGLVMQLHAGSHRNHNTQLFEQFGSDAGADIPVAVNWTNGLETLLQEFGNEPRLRLILFTLDESTYSRELAPLVGHYPALRLGPPWWFMDSIHGIERYLDSVVETTGLANLAGFNDDTRAFASIPARHDVWRRTTCNWLAKQTLRGIVDEADAFEMAQDLAQNLVKDSYRL